MLVCYGSCCAGKPRYLASSGKDLGSIFTLGVFKYGNNSISEGAGVKRDSDIPLPSLDSHATVERCGVAGEVRRKGGGMRQRRRATPPIRAREEELESRFLSRGASSAGEREAGRG